MIPRKNNIEMYLTHNEGKLAVVEIFVRTLTKKVYNFSIRKCVY